MGVGTTVPPPPLVAPTAAAGWWSGSGPRRGAARAAVTVHSYPAVPVGGTGRCRYCGKLSELNNNRLTILHTPPGGPPPLGTNPESPVHWTSLESESSARALIKNRREKNNSCMCTYLVKQLNQTNQINEHKYLQTEGSFVIVKQA